MTQSPISPKVVHEVVSQFIGGALHAKQTESIADATVPNMPFSYLSVERHKKVFGHVPYVVATDRGFFKTENVRRIEEMGVRCARSRSQGIARRAGSSARPESVNEFVTPGA